MNTTKKGGDNPWDVRRGVGGGAGGGLAGWSEARAKPRMAAASSADRGGCVCLEAALVRVD
jgi:hypothetical protein